MYISGWTWRVRLPNAAHGRRRTCKYTHAGIATRGQANSSKVERALLLSVCFKSTGRMIWCESKGNMLRKKKLLSFFLNLFFSLLFCSSTVFCSLTSVVQFLTSHCVLSVYPASKGASLILTILALQGAPGTPINTWQPGPQVWSVSRAVLYDSLGFVWTLCVCCYLANFVWKIAALVSFFGGFHCQTIMY